MIALMVGGPAHGQTLAVPEPPPYTLYVPRRQEPWSVPDLEGPYKPSPEPHQYALRRYRSAKRPEEKLPAYVCMDEPDQIHVTPERDDNESLYMAQLAATLWLQACEDALPGCIAPTCTQKGRYKFTAAEPGRFAGRWWEPGQEIRLCPAHGDDVYRAQGVYGVDGLPDWLKADVMLDQLDAYGMGLFADEIYQSRGRAMRLKAHKGNR